jgi:phosphatidylglycerol:prolipoprotein diacylglycerol transferase
MDNMHPLDIGKAVTYTQCIKAVIHMYNDLFKIGGLTVHGYGLAIGVGVLCAIFLAEHRAKKKGLSGDTVFSIALLALIFGFVGAKLLYGITDLKNVLADPLLLLTGDGFVIYGGIIGGIVAALVYCHVKKVSFLQYFDLLVPSVALAQGFGRIGCFLAGCCFGSETDSGFCLVFKNSLYAPNGVKLIPTQLISSAGDFLIAAVLMLYARKDRKRGRVGGLYLILYSVGRFIIEFFRGDIIRGFVGPLSTSQFVSIFTLLLGLLLFFTNLFKVRKEKAATKADTEEIEEKAEEKDESETDEN